MAASTAESGQYAIDDLVPDLADRFVVITPTNADIWSAPLAYTAGPYAKGQQRVLHAEPGRSRPRHCVVGKGTPLYTFAQDQQPGETKGQGIKDVGTWSAVTTSSSSTPSSTSTTPTAPASSGGGYGY